jgi:hypothetical protein
MAVVTVFRKDGLDLLVEGHRLLRLHADWQGSEEQDKGSGGLTADVTHIMVYLEKDGFFQGGTPGSSHRFFMSGKAGGPGLQNRLLRCSGGWHLNLLTQIDAPRMADDTDHH